MLLLGPIMTFAIVRVDYAPVLRLYPRVGWLVFPLSGDDDLDELAFRLASVWLLRRTIHLRIVMTTVVVRIVYAPLVRLNDGCVVRVDGD